jgi:hypothetical protein
LQLLILMRPRALVRPGLTVPGVRSAVGAHIGIRTNGYQECRHSPYAGNSPSPGGNSAGWGGEPARQPYAQ